MQLFLFCWKFTFYSFAWKFTTSSFRFSLTFLLQWKIRPATQHKSYQQHHDLIKALQLLQQQQSTPQAALMPLMELGIRNNNTVCGERRVFPFGLLFNPLHTRVVIPTHMVVARRRKRQLPFTCTVPRTLLSRKERMFTRSWWWDNNKTGCCCCIIIGLCFPR